MAVSPTKKAGLIPVRELSKVVEAAVKTAHARLGAPAPGPFIKKWEIYGYRMVDSSKAQSLASAVAAEVSKSGVTVDPAVLSIGKDILCGFVERPNLPQERSF